MNISLVVAYDQNMAIGKDGGLAWHLKDDMKWFKQQTLNKMVVMGRTTWESLQVQPLPKRVNLVLSTNKDYRAKGAIVCHSIFDVLTVANAMNVDNLVIIGGGQIYELFFPLANELVVTEVQTEIDQADTHFIPFDKKNWHEVFQEQHAKNKDNDFDFTFRIYRLITAS